MNPRPVPFRYAPELAPLAILETVLDTCQNALKATYPQLDHELLCNFKRGSIERRADAFLLAADRLLVAIAAYRDVHARRLRQDERHARRYRHLSRTVHT